MKDAELAARLEAALGDPPPALLDRLEKVATVDARPDAHRPGPPLWLEVGPPAAAVVLLFAFVAAVVPGLNSAEALSFLAVPAAMLLGIELIRGFPVVRAWFR